MANKLQTYQSVAEQAAKSTAKNRKTWTNFLSTAARMYKYSFPDQLLIYTQRPDAIACAPIETWNSNFNRWVNRGSKGIALIDDTGSYPKLKYVFDVADTEAALHNSRPVQLWEMRHEHQQTILDSLGTVYDGVGENLIDSFHNIAKQLANEYYDDYTHEIRFRAENSLLEELDDLNLRVAFETALTNSITYTLLSRCGLDAGEYFDDEDFRHVCEFSTPDIIFALGTAISESSEQVLRDIETIIKKYERQKATERNLENEHSDNVHTGRGISPAGHQAQRTTEGTDATDGQIRENEESLSERLPESNLQPDVTERNIIPAPERNRGSGNTEDGASDGSVIGADSAPGQSGRANVMDSGDEHPKRTSHGDGSERTDIQLEEAPESESGPQLTNPITETLSTSSITLDEVDSILRDGGNSENSVFRITAFFSKNQTLEQNAAFLRDEYLRGRWGHHPSEGGKGYRFGTEPTSIWFNEAGIKIGRGKSAIHAVDYTVITWEQAAARIKELYGAGMYVSHDVLDEALYNESKENASDFIEFYKNISRGISDIRFDIRKAMNAENQKAVKDSWHKRQYMIHGLPELRNKVYEILSDRNNATQDELIELFDETTRLSEDLPPEWNFDKSHPAVDETITDMLHNKGDVTDAAGQTGIGYTEQSSYARLLTRLKADIDALYAEPNANIRFWRSVPNTVRKIERAGLPTHGFPVADYTTLNYMRFITDDEVDNFFMRSDTHSDRKLRFLSHFLHGHTPKDRIDFVKTEHGHGGGTWTGGGWYEAEPGKGISFKRPDCDEVKLNWTQAARRIQALIETGQFVNRTDLEMVARYERLMLARAVSNFFHNLPDEYERPFNSDLELSYPKDEDWVAIDGLLGNQEKVEKLHTQMQYISENTPQNDRYYALRKRGFDCISAYRDGTYTLFPGIDNLPSPEAPIPRLPELQARNASDREQPQHSDPQLTLFDIEQFPVLPSPDEQQRKIGQANVPNPQINQTQEHTQAPNTEHSDTAPTASTQADFAQTLLSISDEDKIRIIAQFNDNPRSREAVALAREIYGGMDEKLPFSLSELIKLITELVTTGQYIISKPLPELDFDSVAQAYLERVMQDAEFASALAGAESRGTMRRPLNSALDTAIDNHREDEPQVYHAYFSDDDFNDRLFDYVYRQSWEIHSYREIAAEEQPASDGKAERTPVPQSDSGHGTLSYQLRDTFYMDDDKPYVINWIGFKEIGYYSPDKPFISKLLEREELETFIRDNPLNDHLFLQEPVFTEITDPDIIAEVEAVFENHKPILDPAQAQQDIPPPAQDEQAPRTQPVPNFRITDDSLGEGGAKTKFRFNMDAINLLHTLEHEARLATPQEQEILSRYVGWGGLPQAFDPNNKQWKNEYDELKSALQPKEWESARASTLNAHYTSPIIIRAMYEAVERMGFKSGNILEPACGVGNFFGLIPESMGNSKLYGIELDSITARIAKQLYPNSNIREAGFEKTDTPDAFFDLAIGNVPFGNYQVVDKRYDKHKFAIHDYFFAKSLDQVRPGGVVAFITSKFTLDKQNPEVRKYMAQRADLLGAVRLPNNAFLKNAGTETTMDIIFLQKRDRPLDAEPDWIHLGLTDDGIPLNRYFLDNPEMVLGKMALDERMNNKYGSDSATACYPLEGADLAQQLKTALYNIQGQFTIPELDDIDGIDSHAIPADPNVKNFSYTLVAPTPGQDAHIDVFNQTLTEEPGVYFRENSLMYPVDLPATTLERIKGMIKLRDCVHELISLQLDEHEDWEITAKQAELSDLYDSFVADFGLINSQANSRAFNADSAYYLLSSLEILDEDSNFKRKADMFSKRTIKQKRTVTHVDTASEALAVSIGEKARVDLAYMSELTGISEEKLITDLHGVIFLNIGSTSSQEKNYVTADEYLSGNIRKKLEYAKDAQKTLQALGDSSADINVEALKAAMPKELDASEIAVRLGATWIDPKYVEQFMHETLQTSKQNKGIYKVHFHTYTGEWQVEGKGRTIHSDIHATVTYGTGRMNAYQIIDDSLNLRDVRVYDYIIDKDGKKTRNLNKRETTLAQQKQEQLKRKFAEWIWQDPTRRHELVTKYNEMYNSTRPREYDGSHLVFSGISPEINLRRHQINAIARIIYGGNTLLAHAVGAGKTYEMIAAAMESKRLGLANKALFTVPNHLTEQWASEFLRLYPNANILVATKKDFEIRNRKKFCAKIATGDYDAVIIGHSQLEKIPISQERQERHIYEQIWEIEQGIQALIDSGGEQYSIKQLEKTKRSLLARLEKLVTAKKRDDVVTFEQLGVDRLYVDESHYFKNLFLYTKMRNVAGLSTSEAQKSSDLFMKCRYMDELTNNKGTIFATGTPISNSMTEMYTIQRYLQYDVLVEKSLLHFDCWASIFGETQTSIELAPEGTGYRARTRFAKFHNLPELMCMFKDIADIQTADMLNLPVPEAIYDTIIVEPSEIQKEMVQELSKRATLVQARKVDPSEDNMLKITTDGRKIGLDQRLINPLLPDFEGSKVNACTDDIFNTWNETRNERLTQLVFCDFSTPNKDGRFNVYDDIRNKLFERGIPEHEIAFIHDADTEKRKKELFAKVRQGSIRVLFGSTAKLGAGTNVQDRLVAMTDLDCPWRPSDLEQRAGRIIRQGNLNPKVKIRRYATNGTFDSYLWQTVEAKQKFIAQVMTSKSPVRSCEDVDATALSFAEIKALCAGNPLIAEKMNLDIEVAKLQMLKADHDSQRFRLEDSLIKYYPEQIAAAKERIFGIEKDIQTYSEHHDNISKLQSGMNGAVSATAPFAGMTIDGTEYKEKEPAAKALIEACKVAADKNGRQIGKYMGFDMSLRFDAMQKIFSVMLRGAMTYQTEIGTDTFGNITRINNALEKLPQRFEGAKEQLSNLISQQEAAKQELQKPFMQTEELSEKEARLALLNTELNIEGDGGLDVLNDLESTEPDYYENEPYVAYIDSKESSDSYPASAKSAKTSFLDELRAHHSGKQSSANNKKSQTHDI